MADAEDVAAKKKAKSKRPSSGRTKESEGGRERRSSGSEDQKERRSSGGEDRKERRSSGGEERKERRGSGDNDGKERRSSGGEEKPRRDSGGHRTRGRDDQTEGGSSGKHKNKSGCTPRSPSPAKSRLKIRDQSPRKSPNKTAATKKATKELARIGEKQTLDKAFSAAGGKKPRDFEEQSLGDFQKYAGKLGAGLLGTLNASQQSFVPEESLGSFTGFIKKYDEEELLGLHDKPGAYNPYEQQLKKPQQQLRKPNQDASMGDIMNPMKQYGGGAARRTHVEVEDSLGSFTQFAEKYEKDKLLGLQDSELSAPPIVEEEEHNVPEESMDILELLGGEGENDGEESEEVKEESDEELLREETEVRNSLYDENMDIDIGDVDVSEIVDEIIDESSKDVENDDIDADGKDDQDEETLPTIQLPSSRVQQLTKKGGMGYKIMVDTPGGHSPEPMNIVVAIEFEEESETENDDAYQEDTGDAVGRLSRQNLYEKKQDSSTEEDGELSAPRRPAELERWNQSSNNGGNLRPPRTTAALIPPERQSTHSSSTHSTLSSLTFDTNVQLQTDACPSNARSLQRPPGGIRRLSGANILVPHNLGTRRGLLLRQMSEASMKSSISAQTNDSSWADNNDVPENYQASFMQLNLLDLDQTQMQTNEEVQKAKLPDILPSGMEDIPEEEDEEVAAGNLPQGKEHQAASQELLGMKTMLKHIKRVAPRRSRSFEFDRDAPKAMWNSLFARSQKNDLPGSQYVDNDESTEDEVEDNMHANTEGNSEANEGNHQSPADEQTDKNPDTLQMKKSTFMSTIKRVTASSAQTKDKEKDTQEKSSSKGKSSLWSSLAIKTVIRPKDKNQDQGASQEEEAVLPEDHEGDEGDNNDEHDHEKEDVLDEDQHSDDASDHSEGRPRRRHRRKPTNDRGDRSSRGARSALKEHRPQRRAGPARNRAKTTQNMLHQSLGGALDFYAAQQRDPQGEGGGEEEEGEAEEKERLESVGGNGNEEEDAEKKARLRRRPPNRTKSEEGGPSEGRDVPRRTKSSDGLRGMPSRTRSGDNSPARPSRTRSNLDEKNTVARSKKAPPRRTKSTPEGKERAGSHEKGREPVSVKHRVDKVRPIRMTKPPVEPNTEVSGHSRAIQIPENATEEELRELLDYH